jgi:hypothetical protein
MRRAMRPDGQQLSMALAYSIIMGIRIALIVRSLGTGYATFRIGSFEVTVEHASFD